jgi:hypothetical protein
MYVTKSFHFEKERIKPDRPPRHAANPEMPLLGDFAAITRARNVFQQQLASNPVYVVGVA